MHQAGWSLVLTHQPSSTVSESEFKRTQGRSGVRGDLIAINHDRLVACLQPPRSQTRRAARFPQDFAALCTGSPILGSNGPTFYSSKGLEGRIRRISSQPSQYLGSFNWSTTNLGYRYLFFRLAPRAITSEPSFLGLGRGLCS